MSTSPPSPGSLEKVLKIGLLVEDQVIEERVIPAKQDVVVGGGAPGALVVPGLESSLSVPVLVHRNGRYWVRTDGRQKGRLTSEGQQLSLDKAFKAGEGVLDGDARLFSLNDEDKGRITLGKTDSGTVALLFRFVEAPVVMAPPPPDAPSRSVSSSMAEDDRVFYQLLVTFSVLAILFSVYVKLQPPVEPDLDKARSVMAKIIIPPERREEIIRAQEEKAADAEKPAEEEKEKPAEEEKEKPAEEKEKPAEKETETKAQEKSDAPPVDPAAAAAAAKAASRQKMMSDALFNPAAITTRGAGAGRAVVTGGSNTVEAMKYGTPSSSATSGSAIKTGGMGGGPREDIRVAGPSVSEVASGPVKTTEVVVPVAKVEFSDPEMDDAANLPPVKAAVNRYKGQLKQCYEKELKANPKLKGRVVVEWDIVGGASSVEITSNSTGSSELAECIKSRVRNWRFEGTEDGHTSYPMVFQPEE